MISEERVEKALRYLAESDLPAAEAKADMERQEVKCKTVKQTVFLHSEGTVAERTAIADTHQSVIDAQAEYFESIAVYMRFANKRETERILIDLYRTICANRRKGE